MTTREPNSRRFQRINSISGLLWIIEDEIFPERHLADPEALERFQRHLRELAEEQAREAAVRARANRIRARHRPQP